MLGWFLNAPLNISVISADASKLIGAIQKVCTLQIPPPSLFAYASSNRTPLIVRSYVRLAFSAPLPLPLTLEPSKPWL